MSDPLLVTKQAAAEALGCCVRTIDSLISTKQLPHRKLGRRTLVPYSALQQIARRDTPVFSGRPRAEAEEIAVQA